MTEKEEEQEKLLVEDLRSQCRLRGIKFHHRANAETLVALLRKKDEEENPINARRDLEKPLSELDRRNKKRLECIRMKRVMITCNDPMKIDYLGEVFQAGNSFVTTIKKYCPFNNTNGWYMPQILLNSIEEKMFRRKNTDQRNAQSGGLAKAYNVTYLNDLTPAEFAALKHQQELRRVQQGG